MKVRTLLFGLAALIAATPALAADPINGRWLTEEKDAIITIGKCGDSVCGRITKFLVAPPDGLDQRDIYNDDPKKRTRKLLGLPVLTQFAKDDDLWRGRIYDPKSGNTYRSVVRRKSANTLEVKGCIGPFCLTQLWTKAK